MGATWIEGARSRAAKGRQRLGAYLSRRPWAARAAAIALLVILGLVSLLVLFAAIIVAVPILIIVAVGAAVRGGMSRARAPNGLLDGRRNVRVRDSAG